VNVLAAVLVAATVWSAIEAWRGARLMPARRRRLRPSRITEVSASAGVSKRQFWTVSLFLSALVFGVLWTMDHTFVVSAVPSVAAAGGPYLYWSSRRRREAEARFRSWPDALRLIIGRIQAGGTLHEALEALGVSGPDPLRAVMSRYARLAPRVGYRQALDAVRTELADAVSDSVLLTLATALDEGTDQVLSILANLAGQIQGDIQLAEKVQTLQAQSRIATWAVFSLPYLLLMFLCATQGFYRQFFSEGAGVIVVCLGAVLSVLGLTIARRLARPIATQQRVFTSAVTR
jgi:Flp pilus assembly protein TadB